MATNTIVSPGADGAIVLEGRFIRTRRPLAFEAPKAAALLSDAPAEAWLATLEEFLEYGAIAVAAVRTNANMQLLESRMADMLGRLDAELKEKLNDRLEKDRDAAKETLMRLLEDHRTSIHKLLLKYTDPDSKDGFPALLAMQLDQISKATLRQVDELLEDGEEGVLARVSTKLTKQIRETERVICERIAARQELKTHSALRGRSFEDALGVRLPDLVRPTGSLVERCGDGSGAKAQKHGDYLITLDLAATRGEEVRLAIEAKSQKTRFTTDRVRAACKQARENRGASAGIFVAETREVLPDSLAFGQVSSCDFFCLWSPEDGDDLALTCAIYMARAAALASFGEANTGTLDRGATQRELAVIRQLLEQFDKLEASHSQVDKQIAIARGLAGSLKADILAALRRLADLVDQV
jgi:hypothetical protein